MSKSRNTGPVENGSGTLVCVGVIISTALCVCALVIAGHIFTVRYHLQAVADISALGGAEISATAQFTKIRSRNPGRECSVARDIAAHNEVHVKECFSQGADTFVTVGRPIRIGPIQLVAHARSRAGPL